MMASVHHFSMAGSIRHFSFIRFRTARLRAAPLRIGALRILTIALLAMLTLAGCGKGSKHNDTPAPQPVVVSTNVVKGIMSGADVALYAITNGVKGDLVTRTTSNAAGEFTLTIPAGVAGPFLVEASTISGTRLRCDVQGGCGATNAGSSDDINSNGSTDWGEFYPAPVLTLTAVAADANALAKLSVTPLTHLVARYAAGFPQGWDGLSIAVASSQLTNLLALDTDISALRSFDITQPAPAGVTADQWNYALLNAAFAALATDGAASPTLGEWLNQIADDFALNDGQLLARHDDNGAFNAEDLVTRARALGTGLYPSGDAYFARLLLQLQAFTTGQYTHAQPDSGITNSTLDNVNGFLDDWKTWRTDLPLYADGQPFADTQADYQEHLQAQWTLTQVLASASQYAPIAAAPTLFLQQYCDSQTSPFYRNLCNTLLVNKTICLFPLAINGELLCDYLTHLELPMNNGLIATVDIFSQTATLKGTVNNQVIDLLMVAEQSSSTQITMHVSGNIQGERYSWTLMNGSNTFNYASALSTSNLKFPDSLQSDITLTYTAQQQSGGNLLGDMHAKFDVNLDAWRAIDWSSDIDTALASVPLTLEMTGTFSQPYNGNGYILIKGGSNNWLEFELPQQSSHNGLLAQVRLGGTLAQWQSGLLNAKVTWNNHTLTARYSGTNLQMENDHSIRLIMPEGSDSTGTLYAGTQRYGRLYQEDDVWWVQLGDNTEEPL